MSYSDKVWKFLQKNNYVTSKKIEELTGTVCAYSVIRDIRKKYGYECLGFKDKIKKRKFIENGKIKTETKRYREWFLKKLEA